MQFIDLHKQFDVIESTLRKKIDNVLTHKRFIMGDEVKEIEHNLASYVGVKHAITCANGTDALVISLKCFNLKKDDAVFVPSFSFFASAEAISLAGGTPVFVDVDNTYNICPKSLAEAIKIVKKQGKLSAKGIVTVDLFGLPANYNVISKIAKENGLFILEDSAQGFGGVYNEKKSCSFGDIATTSFFPAKPLGCYGDGGAIFTDRDDITDLIKSMRVHGKGQHKYDNVRIGYNSRLDTIQAAILLAKFDVFEEELKRRNEIADMYSDKLKGVLKTPIIPEGYRSAWAQYTLACRDKSQRDSVMSKLEQNGIPTMVYYLTPIHKSSAYSNLQGVFDTLPNSEIYSNVVFSLPMHPYLKNSEIDFICSEVNKAIK